MIKPIIIPNTGIQWNRPSIKTVAIAVEEGNPYQTEVVRLEAKYGRVLSKKETAKELGVSPKTLDRRIAECDDIPQYKEQRSGRHIFPISAVATYLSQALVKTA